MSDLTKIGRKYNQPKSANSSQEVQLKYYAHEIMSKKIHEAMKAELGYKLILGN